MFLRKIVNTFIFCFFVCFYFLFFLFLYFFFSIFSGRCCLTSIKSLSERSIIASFSLSPFARFSFVSLSLSAEEIVLNGNNSKIVGEKIKVHKNTGSISQWTGADSFPSWEINCDTAPGTYLFCHQIHRR